MREPTFLSHRYAVMCGERLVRLYRRAFDPWQRNYWPTSTVLRPNFFCIHGWCSLLFDCSGFCAKNTRISQSSAVETWMCWKSPGGLQHYRTIWRNLAATLTSPEFRVKPPITRFSANANIDLSYKTNLIFSLNIL